MGNLLRERFSNFRLAEDAKENGYYAFFRTFQSKQETEVKVNGKDVLMFGSNSYLGLTTHPKVIEAAEAAVRKYGSSCSGSRFLNGTTDMHEELEHRLAKFLDKEEAIVFSTGFQVNLGVLPAIARQGDALLLDRMNHASIYEGAKLSDASSVIFRHNDMQSLEKRLSQLQDANNRIIVVDGIFSMEGNIAKVPEIVELAKKYNASVMTDCAHAIGVLGDHGKGTPDHFNLTDEVELIGGTFSKSLASLGGFIAGDKETIQYIKHIARSLIFSASMTPSSTAATLAALDIMETDDSRRLKLWENTNYSLNRLKELGFDTGYAET
ncbi:MAG: aminotransferase class I/II-fold pyridoxal phosphate-dependent enzyme, partial [Ekhidna sp.]|nr:aminotransferase class I/II-fold pyridoxal phosphate-dependent enzyme [Ekhidna sp.]